jgi:cytochrome aa3-600 menaquinol oxidase subunit 2
MDSETITNPELYKTHGYQGKIFEEDSENNSEMNHSEMNESDGG